MGESILQTKLDNIVTEIVRLEDEITSITNEIKNYETLKGKLSEDIDVELSKNLEKILHHQSLIKNEQEKESIEIKRKEEEKIRLSSYIKDIEDEIVNLKHKELEKNKEMQHFDKKLYDRNAMSKCELEMYEKKRQEQAKEALELAKKNLEIKKDLISLEITKLTELQKNLNAELESLIGKKELYEEELVELISQKETLEELVKGFCITKNYNLIEENNSNNINNKANDPNKENENKNQSYKNEEIKSDNSLYRSKEKPSLKNISNTNNQFDDAYDFHLQNVHNNSNKLLGNFSPEIKKINSDNNLNNPNPNSNSNIKNNFNINMNINDNNNFQKCESIIADLPNNTKNLNISNSFKNIQIKIEDIKCIDKIRFGKVLFDYFFEVDTSMHLLDKLNFEKVMKSQLDNFTGSNGIFSSDDILLLLTKKIFDLMSENKKFNENNPFSSERIRIFMKFFIKIQIYESLINEKFNFVNEEFSAAKKGLESQLNDIAGKISSYENQLEKIIFKQKSVFLDSPSKEKDWILSDSNSHVDSPYRKAIGKLESKLLELIELKNDIEIQVIKIKNAFGEKVDEYNVQIKHLEFCNTQLREKQLQIPYEIEDFKIKNNDNIILIRGEIAEKFQLIKELFKQDENNHISNYNFNSSNSLYQEGYINGINNNFNHNSLINSNFPNTNNNGNVNNNNSLFEACIDKIRQSVNQLKKSSDNINNNCSDANITSITKDCFSERKKNLSNQINSSLQMSVANIPNVTNNFFRSSNASDYYNRATNSNNLMYNKSVPDNNIVMEDQKNSIIGNYSKLDKHDYGCVRMEEASALHRSGKKIGSQEKSFIDINNNNNNTNNIRNQHNNSNINFQPQQHQIISDKYSNFNHNQDSVFFYEQEKYKNNQSFNTSKTSPYQANVRNTSSYLNANHYPNSNNNQFFHTYTQVHSTPYRNSVIENFNTKKTNNIRDSNRLENDIISQNSNNEAFFKNLNYDNKINNNFAEVLNYNQNYASNEPYQPNYESEFYNKYNRLKNYNNINNNGLNNNHSLNKINSYRENNSNNDPDFNQLYCENKPLSPREYNYSFHRSKKNSINSFNSFPIHKRNNSSSYFDAKPHKNSHLRYREENNFCTGCLNVNYNFDENKSSLNNEEEPEPEKFCENCNRKINHYVNISSLDNNENINFNNNSRDDMKNHNNKNNNKIRNNFIDYDNQQISNQNEEGNFTSPNSNKNKSNNDKNNRNINNKFMHHRQLSNMTNKDNSDDISYLNEKYERNRKLFYETKQFINQQQANIDKQKKIPINSIESERIKIQKNEPYAGMNTHNLNYSKKNHIPNNSVARNYNGGKMNHIGKTLSILSDKEILNNSIRNIKNEINSHGDVDRFNEKIKTSSCSKGSNKTKDKTEKEKENKKSMNNIFKSNKKIQDFTSNKVQCIKENNDNKNNLTASPADKAQKMMTMTSIEKDYLTNNQTASGICSTKAFNFEQSEKKILAIMLGNVLKEKLLDGQMRIKVYFKLFFYYLNNP